MKTISAALLALSGTALANEWVDWGNKATVTTIITRTHYVCPCDSTINPLQTAASAMMSSAESSWLDWVSTGAAAAAASASSKSGGNSLASPALTYLTTLSRLPYFSNATTSCSSTTSTSLYSNSTTTSSASTSNNQLTTSASTTSSSTTSSSTTSSSTTSSSTTSSSTTSSSTTTTSGVTAPPDLFRISLVQPNFGPKRGKRDVVIDFVYFPAGSATASTTQDVTLAALFFIDNNGNLKFGASYIDLDSSAGYTAFKRSFAPPAVNIGGWVRNNDGSLTSIYATDGFCVTADGNLFAELSSPPPFACLAVILKDTDISSSSTTTTTSSATLTTTSSSTSSLSSTLATSSSVSSSSLTTTTSITSSTTSTTSTTSSLTSTTSSSTTTTTSTSAHATDFVKASTLGDYQTTVLQQHNIHRANHSAADLTWSTKMAQIAAQIAANCVYQHNTTAGGGGYGQNIGAGFTAGQIAFMITNNMYDNEMPNYPGPYGSDNVDTSNFESWGHFSQIVWAGTTQVGCATQYCPNGLANTGSGVPPYFTVCNYSPPGNYVGQWSNVRAPLGGATVVIVN